MSLIEKEEKRSMSYEMMGRYSEKSPSLLWYVITSVISNVITCVISNVIRSDKKIASRK